MNKQRKVLITTTYNEMGIIIDTKAEEVAQPENTDCDYCHEDVDGYVKPIEKNGHAVVRCSPIDGWILSVRYGSWRKDVPIRFCPMCGRRLERG